jgi:hypothetical protein
LKREEVNTMKKRKWWFWLLIALACVTIVVTVAELTGASIISIFGWGALGAIGIFALVLLACIAFIIPFVFRTLLRALTSNHERLSLILGGLGLCAIIAGWIGTGLEARWSLFVTMSGFSMGCLAGAEYQEYLSERDANSERVREQTK